jgi:hypothetical protein
MAHFGEGQLQESEAEKITLIQKIFLIDFPEFLIDGEGQASRSRHITAVVRRTAGPRWTIP